MATSSKSTQLFQDFLENLHSKKLLQYAPLYQPEVPSVSPYARNRYISISSNSSGSNSSFDSKVVVILSVLLCAVICIFVLFCFIKCALKCSGLIATESGANPLAQLASKGVKQKVLKTFPIVKYSAECKLPTGLDTDCVICLSEFAPGEYVRILPKCNHVFHVLCVDKWLGSHSSCPTCRHSLTETSQKIVGCSQPSSSVVPTSDAGGHCV